ncbi:MAG: sugar phosphate isomerase/epimerase family protein [Thermoguttaceae bacterium]
MSPIHRREFLAAAGAAGAGLVVGPRLEAGPLKTKLYKAMTLGEPTEALLERLKGAGFDGMETNAWNVPLEKAAKARQQAEKIGMKIHSVLFGWANFNSPDKAQVASELASVGTALRAAAAYGATALLLVPCRTGVTPRPEPWQFDIDFDEKTGHVRRVVRGDNAPYQAYIAAQNHATDTSREAVEKLIPTAEKTGVPIALENVWNHLWVQPKLFAHFVRSFRSRWVRAYFDIGNHVKYAPPEEWVRALGRLIVKFHVKDFKLNPDGRDGRFVHPRDGSVNWPLVRREIDALDYNDFLTIEDSGLTLQEFSQRLDLIIAGK